MSLPNPRSLYFGLKPINSFDCKSISSCNCPLKEGKFQSVRVCTRAVILKGVGSGISVPSTSLMHVPVLVNGDEIIVYFIEDSQRCLLSFMGC